MSDKEVVLKLFKSSVVSCQYIMPNGKYLYFVKGKFATDDPEEIAELEKAIKARHPHIFVDTKETEITAAKMNDPLSEIKAKAIAEYLAQQATGKDFGKSDTAMQNITTTAKLTNLKESNAK